MCIRVYLWRNPSPLLHEPFLVSSVQSHREPAGAPRAGSCLGWGRGGWGPRRAFTAGGGRGHNLGSKLRSPYSLEVWISSRLLTDTKTPSLRAETRTEHNHVPPPLPFRHPSLPTPTSASTSHPRVSVPKSVANVSAWGLEKASRCQKVWCCSVAQSCPTFCDPWTASLQASLSITNSQSLLKFMSIKSMMPSNHLILCRPLLLPPSIFPSIRVFSNESVLHIRWPKYWSFSFSISPSNDYSGQISFRMDWFGLLTVQRTLKSLLQTTVQKHEFLGTQPSLVQFSHPYMTTGKTIKRKYTLPLQTRKPNG